MPKSTRILIAIGILLVDVVIFFLPLTAIFLMYIIIANPPWFTKFLNEMQ